MWPWPRSPLSNSLRFPRFSAPAATRSGRGFCMRIWRGTENAFPFLGRWPSVVRPDEVVPAMCSMPRRMRSSPCCTRNLPFPMRAAFGACSETLAVSFGVARNLPFPLQAAAQLLGNSRFFLFCYALCCAGLPRHPCAGANAAPAPAQGVSPLDPFPLARSLGVARTCRFQRGRPSAPARKLTSLPFLFIDSLCCAWAAATSLRRG